MENGCDWVALLLFLLWCLLCPIVVEVSDEAVLVVIVPMLRFVLDLFVVVLVEMCLLWSCDG